MKTKLLHTASLAVLICLFLSLQTPVFAQIKYNISGRLVGGAGKTLYFSPDTYIPNTDKQQADSVKIAADDSIKLSGKIKYPGIYSIFLHGQKAFLPFFLDANPVVISADASAIYRGSIAGAEDQKLMTEFQSADLKVQQALERNLSLAQSASKARDTALVMVYRTKGDSLNRIRQAGLLQFAKAHPDSYQTLGNIEAFMGTLISHQEAERQLLPLSKKFGNNPLYSKVTGLIAGHKVTTPGNVLPDIVLPDTTGKNMVSLKTIRASNKYVLLDFWASWCAPCRANNPALLELYKKYHPQKLEIVGISLDSDKKSWIKAIKADQTNWLHLSDLKGMAGKYAVTFNTQTIPTYMLIDSSGKLILNTHDMKEMSDKVASLF